MTAPRRCSLRFAIVAVVCLLLGAVTTVGVAWWCLHARAMTSTQTIFDAPWPWPPPKEWSWPSAVCDDMPKTEAYSGSGWRYMKSRHHSRFMMVWECGWPILAVCSVVSPAEPHPEGSGWQLISYRRGLFRDGVNRPFPLMPIFPGFAVDTGVYAAAWWVVIFAPIPLYRAGRRRVRVSRGMCGSCGYDLKGSNGTVCPECGA